jgi:thioredoxin-like negative regulator of GroEL
VEQVSMALMGKVKFAKVDIDANPELVLPHDIKTIPALIAFHEGKSLGRISLTGLGFTENNVKEAVHNYLEFKGVSI